MGTIHFLQLSHQNSLRQNFAVVSSLLSFLRKAGARSVRLRTFDFSFYFQRLTSYLAAVLVALIIVAVFKSSLLLDGTDLKHADYMWRLLIGLGCIPGCIALYFRLTIPETPRFTMDIERNVRQAALDVESFLANGTFFVDPDAPIQRVLVPKASKRDFLLYFRRWENMKVLIGTSWSWFAQDVSIVIHTILINDVKYYYIDCLLRPQSQLVYHSQRYWTRWPIEK